MPIAGPQQFNLPLLPAPPRWTQQTLQELHLNHTEKPTTAEDRPDEANEEGDNQRMTRMQKRKHLSPKNME